MHYALFSEDARVRLGGSGKINWKSVASEGTPVERTRTGLRRPKAAGRERSLGKMRGDYFTSKRSNGRKKKKKEEKHSETPNWAKPHNGTGRCIHDCWRVRSGDARQASQVQGWQTRSLGAAILILGMAGAASGSRARENAVVP